MFSACLRPRPWCITIQNTRSELLVTVSTSLSKWEPGILQNPRVADSAMMDFWILPRPFTNTRMTQGKSQRDSGPHCSLTQNRMDNIGLFQNLKLISWKRESFEEPKVRVESELFAFHNIDYVSQKPVNPLWFQKKLASQMLYLQLRFFCCYFSRLKWQWWWWRWWCWWQQWWRLLVKIWLC